jgi:hypothetical protein
MPPERLYLTDENTHPESERQISQAMLILRLGGTGRPLLLVDDVPEIVQLGGWNRVARLDDLPVRAPKPDHPTVGRIGRERIESGGTDMPPDLLQILACRAPNTQAKIEDELIDVRAHATLRERF